MNSNRKKEWPQTDAQIVAEERKCKAALRQLMPGTRLLYRPKWITETMQKIIEAVNELQPWDKDERELSINCTTPQFWTVNIGLRQFVCPPEVAVGVFNSAIEAINGVKFLSYEPKRNS